LRGTASIKAPRDDAKSNHVAQAPRNTRNTVVC
jgi:hypothetical protein